MSLLATSDVSGAIFLLVVLAFFGRLVVRSTDRMRQMEQAVFRTTCVLAVLTGLVAAFMPDRVEVPSDDGLLGLLVTGGIAGLMSACGWYFVVAVVFFLWEYVVSIPFRLMAKMLRSMQRTSKAREATLKVERERRQREDEWKRGQPIREREAREKMSDQQRREDARSRVELFFNVNAPELKNRFTREMLDDYVKRYMGDDKTAQVVEERAAALLKTIQQHLDKVVSPIRNLSFDEILAAFEARKIKIKQSALEEQDIKTLLIQLDEEREAAVKQAMRDGVL